MNSNLDFVPLEGEEFRDIAGFEGKYQISNLGRVLSLNYCRTGRPQIMKPRDNGQGYLEIQLRKDGKKKHLRINRLVAIAFIPNPNNFDTVDHINHIRTDNRVENLRWLDFETNSLDGALISAEKSRKKVYCQELDRTFESVSKCAKELNLNNGNISSACNGRQKTCGKLHFKFVD